jgi:hypothetical protein
MGILPGWENVRLKSDLKCKDEDKVKIMKELVNNKCNTLDDLLLKQLLPKIVDFVKVRERLLSLLFQELCEHHPGKYFIENYDWLVEPVIYKTDDKLKSFLHTRVILGKVTTFTYQMAIKGDGDKKKLYEFIDAKVRNRG